VRTKRINNSELELPFKKFEQTRNLGKFNFGSFAGGKAKRWSPSAESYWLDRLLLSGILLPRTLDVERLQYTQQESGFLPIEPRAPVVVMVLDANSREFVQPRTHWLDAAVLGPQPQPAVPTSRALH
jgi:hypothetical protein